MAGFTLDIALADFDIALSWEDVGGPYDVWRSTDPYFAPGNAGATLLASGITGTSYVDVWGNDETTYYYRVESNGGLSSIAGKFCQQIEKGYNKVSQPLITDIDSADEFAHSFKYKIDAAYKWLPDQGRYVHWYHGFDPSWGIFTYDLGNCPIAQPAWAVQPFVHRTVGQVPAYGEMGITLHPGHNYVTLPLDLGDMMASELLGLLPPDASVAQFTPSGPGQPYSGGPVGDFAIDAGACVSVTVSDVASWPPLFDPLEELSDDFEDGDLEGWEIHEADSATVTVEGGRVVIVPEPNTQWYQTDEAFQLSRPVSGNFAVTASVSVTNANGGPTIPGDPLRIGGLMLRDPDATLTSTYHVGLGVLLQSEMIFEHKSTEYGSSTVGTAPWPSTDAELRICRLGDQVHGLVRSAGGSWQLMHSRTRVDLPTTVLAGPIAYGSQADPDLRCEVDEIVFESIASFDDCLAD